MLDMDFKKTLNDIVSQLPKKRQTLLFSATQTKSIQDLARLSLKDPEYISVHEESVTATPTGLRQTALTVPLEQKLDMLWSFIKSHLNSRTLVFLSTRKQVSLMLFCINNFPFLCFNVMLSINCSNYKKTSSYLFLFSPYKEIKYGEFFHSTYIKGDSTY